jgi:DNA-binding winged helix-turn-helix (wHTH) protein
MLYTFGDHYTLDPARYELRQHGTLVRLEPRVFDLLAYLVQHPDQTVTKEELLAQLWPQPFVADDALTYCVAQARKALGDTGQTQRYIQTVRRRGYRFLPLVAVLQPLPPTLARPCHTTSQAQPDLQRLHDRSDPGIAWNAVRPPAGTDVRPPIDPAASMLGEHHNESTTFIGRRQYLNWFETCFQDAQAGHPRVVFLTGEAGVGKTRLLRELRRAALHQGLQVWAARCYEDLALPYLPFIEGLLPLLEQLPPEGQHVL